MVAWIDFLKAALFGLVEGITEWLPISSTGHMLLLNHVVTLNVSEAFWKMFLVVIQLGAILSVCVVFFKDLNPFSSHKTSDEKRLTWGLWAKTIVACIPAALVGIPFDTWIEDHLSGPVVIAITLIVYGAAFIGIESLRAARARHLYTTEAAHGYQGHHFAEEDRGEDQRVALAMSASELADQDARVGELEQLDWKTAMGIGCFQVLSIVPGTSRSGSTIIGGLLLGCSRPVAAQFTFYLAIPVMLGASFLRIVKYLFEGIVPSMTELSILGIGCVVAFVVSLITVRLLMAFVRRHSFTAFGVYRIVLGALIIVAVVTRFLG